MTKSLDEQLSRYLDGIGEEESQLSHLQNSVWVFGTSGNEFFSLASDYVQNPSQWSRWTLGDIAEYQGHTMHHRAGDKRGFANQYLIEDPSEVSINQDNLRDFREKVWVRLGPKGVNLMKSLRLRIFEAARVVSSGHKTDSLLPERLAGHWALMTMNQYLHFVNQHEDLRVQGFDYASPAYIEDATFQKVSNLIH